MTAEGKVRLVSGKIVFGEGSEAFSGAILTVSLEEVGRADAPSSVVAEQTRHGVTWQPGEPGQTSFQLEGPAPDKAGQYIISAHLDVDGDGKISRGDYITMESYPVLTRGYPRRVTVHLKRIG